MWLVAALACSGEDGPDGGDPTASEPEDTFTGGAVEPPLGDDVVPFPACEPGPTDGRLDVAGACIDGVCIGQTLDEAAAGYGGSPYCLALAVGSTSCFFGEYVFASYTDADLDGQPDDGKRAYLLQAFVGWPGGSDDGLAPGISPACWVEALGPPDSVGLVSGDDGFYAVSLGWSLYYLTVSDQQDDAYQFFPDGIVEQIAFQNGVYGP
jgi:hypothetical protein